jgi:hypothetical protein
MRSATKDPPSWTRGRFLGLVGVLFVFQAGLIFLFGDRSGPLSPLSAPSVRFRALGASLSEDQLLRRFFVGDPAVFPLPNPHGFSGRGWLNQRPLAHTNEIQLEPPIWLDFYPARLGTNVLALPSSYSGFVLGLVDHLGTDFPVLPSGSEPILASLVEQRSRREEPLPVFLPPEIMPTQSVFRLDGGLGDRLLGAGPALRAWPCEKLLTNSVVQIAVDPLGEVVAARLESRCGLAEADVDAVAKANALRFRPSPAAGTKWGEAVFEWQTTEQAGAGPPK